MPSIQNRLSINNSEYFRSLKPVQEPIKATAPSLQISIPIAGTEDNRLSPHGNPSPNRSLLPAQFTYDFDTYRMYPSYFSFSRRWVNTK